jgi:transcriptional regulator with XRE-family HTH domain
MILLLYFQDGWMMGRQEVRAVLSGNLKFFRSLRAMSQADLAEKAGISIIFLSDIERSNKWPSLDTLVNLADALKVETYELLKPVEKSGILPQTYGDLLRKYTDDAAFILSQSLEKVVTQSLKDLQNHYIEMEDCKEKSG